MKIFKQNNRLVKGSTIIETIVSLSILLSILTLFFTQYDKVNSSLNPHKIHKAFEITNQVFLSKELLIDGIESITIDTYIVNKKVSPKENGLYLVEVTILDKNAREIYKRTKWISEKIEL